jgi:ADP-ribosylglycohydrolase
VAKLEIWPIRIFSLQYFSFSLVSEIIIAMRPLDRILGCIAGAAAGDAMGAATELLTIREITSIFGYVENYMAATEKSPAYGLPPGTVTDDFSMGYYLAKTVLKSEGNITNETAQEALISWAEHKEYLRFVGPTTRAALEKLRVGEKINPKASCNIMSTTNGAAMKIFGLALVCTGDLEDLCHKAYMVALSTHANSASIAGACAIACAVSTALSENHGSDEVEKIIEAAVFGAKTGYNLAVDRGFEVPAPSVERRIALAVEIGTKSKDHTTLINSLAEIIGTGIAVSESVPCALGIFAAENQNPWDGIKIAANIGGDTDTIASMYGAIAGALRGVAAFPADCLPFLESSNHLGFFKLAEEIVKFRL